MVEPLETMIWLLSFELYLRLSGQSVNRVTLMPLIGTFMAVLDASLAASAPLVVDRMGSIPLRIVWHFRPAPLERLFPPGYASRY